ncbi:MAG: uncharacterized protein K0R15_958 [Clostridiales bacterium]|jgi:murein DD-endopeptidase MepM/ murein hydrolase activator NlpD|nr:uncharacterized protein [Clostridiales bacterium]
MNGISKYSELRVFKKFKVIAVTLSVAAASIFTINNVIVNNNGNGMMSAFVKTQIPVYRVLVQGEEVGFVSNELDAYTIVSEVKAQIIEKTGKDLLLESEIEFIAEEAYADVLKVSIKDKVYKVMNSNVDKSKQKAIMITIDDYSVVLENQEAAEAVLNYSKGKYDPANQFYIELEESAYTQAVLKSSIIKNEIQAKSFVMTTASTGEPVASADPISEAPILGLEFGSNVMISQVFVKSDQIKTIEDAVADITMEKEANKTYVIKAGDTLSGIARNYNTSIEGLIAINAGMTETSVLAIDQEITVVVPEPKLSFITLEAITYTENYSVPVEYVENASLYKGNQNVIRNGSQGVKEFEAIQKKSNGKVIETEITSETIIKEAVAKKVEKGTKALPQRVATGKYIRPIKGGVTSSSYGYRNGAFHSGVDWSAPYGTTVVASDGGTVIAAGWNGTYGKCVVINHGNGIKTRYAHLSSISVSVGQKLAQNEKLGAVGSTGRSTGNHLHFELIFDSVTVNPVKYISN